MGFLLILPILVSGFIYCHKHPSYFFKLHRYEGQYLYLQVAHLGIKSLLIAIIFHLTLTTLLYIPIFLWKYHVAESYSEILANHLVTTKLTSKNPEQFAWLIIISVTMILIPYVMSFLYVHIQLWKLKRNDIKELIERKKKEPASVLPQRSISDIKTMLRSRLVNDSPLEKLLFDAYSTGSNILFTLNDRKIYVGRIAGIGDLNEHQGSINEIEIVPVVSGYRDKDTLEAKFTTKYKDIEGNFLIVLKQENIVSASIFDFSTYKLFNKDEEPKVNNFSRFFKRIYTNLIK